ncbi:MAG: hypothetical protein Q9216_003325 [Gyalolechia sp. 2 TL-2023]
MAPKTPTPRADEIDDILDYAVNMQDVFRDVDVRMDIPNDQQDASSRVKNDSLGLGIDKEIKVVKTRQPVPKLDENRLLSQAGIPKLKHLARDRMKFKGKNHEYSDIACLLNVYQLWLDDLYPRAKFADGLAMIEKLGHSKKIQIMRREWISHGKSQDRFGSIRTPQDGQQVAKASEQLQNKSDVNDDSGTTEEIGARHSSVPNDDDLYAASPPTKQHVTSQRTPRVSTSADVSSGGNDDNGVPEDDLDTLLADTSTDIPKRFSTNAASPKRSKTTPLSQENDFDAEMEVMAEMDELW